MRADAGQVMVLEAIVLTLVLLGAAYAVTTLQEPHSATARPRERLEGLATDALVVLAGQREEGGTLLDLGMTEAIHCALGENPSPDACTNGRGANLSFKIENFLPQGAGYAIALHNGLKPRDLYRSTLPSGEVVAGSFSYTPAWNMTFILTELSCYEPGQDMNATLLPLRHSAPANVAGILLHSSDGGPHAAEPAVGAAHASAWNASVPAAGRPTTGTLWAQADGGSTPFGGAVSFATCDLGGRGGDIVDALRESRLAFSSATAPVGQPVKLDAETNPLAEIPGARLASLEAIVYEPVSPRDGVPDTYLRRTTIDLLGDEPAWTPPADSLFGTHVVVLSARLEVVVGVNEVPVEARKLALLDVALPGGVVPHDPPYRAVLQAWFPDWR